MTEGFFHPVKGIEVCKKPLATDKNSSSSSDQIMAVTKSVTDQSVVPE